MVLRNGFLTSIGPEHISDNGIVFWNCIAYLRFPVKGYRGPVVFKSPNANLALVKHKLGSLAETRLEDDSTSALLPMLRTVSIWIRSAFEWILRVTLRCDLSPCLKTLISHLFPLRPHRLRLSDSNAVSSVPSETEGAWRTLCRLYCSIAGFSWSQGSSWSGTGPWMGVRPVTTSTTGGLGSSVEMRRVHPSATGIPMRLSPLCQDSGRATCIFLVGDCSFLRTGLPAVSLRQLVGYSNHRLITVCPLQ